MNLKYYIRGVGMGVVITTIILTIAFNIRQGQETDNITTENTGSFLESIRGSKEETKGTEDDSSSHEESKESESSSQGESRSSEPETESLKPTEPETKAPVESTAAQQRDVTVDLTSVGSSEQACRVIEEAGLVTNWAELNAYLINNGYESRIQSRVFTIKTGSDYEVIARIITGR